MANQNVVPQGLFGPGILWLTRTDISNGTPVNVGFINEFSYDFSFETKQLFGQNQFPLLAARGTAKCSGKMKAATQSGLALNTLLLGGNWTAGTQYDVAQQTLTIAATNTMVPPSSGAYNADLGVVYATGANAGKPLTQVSAGPAAGQYSVNQATGVYTFNAGDVGASAVFSYAYTFTSGATGQNQTIGNSLIGTTPTFQMDYKTTLYGATYYLRLFQCIGAKWSMAHKITDFALPEYDFEFFANAAQQIGILSLASQA
jgi:hypothetical protein